MHFQIKNTLKNNYYYIFYNNLILNAINIWRINIK